MSEYVITTDNNSDLPEEYLKDHGVGCMYLSYSMDGKNYTHGNFLPEHEFYEAMRNGSMPTTAQVNPENAKALLEPYLKEGKDILHIAFSSALSGTYNSSRIAAEELIEDYPDRKIIVVDSLGASLGQGLLVYLAQEKKEQGEDMETVAKWAEENRLHMVHLFTVNDLNHLYRGGRISRTTAVVGSMLNIKPVLHVDNDGKLTAIGKVRDPEIYRSQYHCSRHLTEGKSPLTAYCFSQPPQGIYLIRLNKSPAVVQKASNSACCRKWNICQFASTQRRNGKGFRAHLRVHSNSWYLGSCVIQKNLTV